MLTACGGSEGSGASPDGTHAENSNPRISDAGISDAGISNAQGSSSPDAAPPADDAGIAAPDADAADADTHAANKKRGVAYGHHSDADLAALSKGIAWWYNWSPSPDSTLSSSSATSGVEFVPMIWGGTFDPNTLATRVPADAKYLLTFNEPNFGTQSNLTPAQAAALWPKVEAFAKSRGLKIVSPALNYCGGNCNETDPFVWLDKFFAACTGCQVDYIAAHWYACSKSALTGYITKYETKYQKPIWLTEFSCLDSPATAASEETYMAEALAALEADPMVFRYSWFTGRFTQRPEIDLLGTTSGALTPLGQKYIALPGGH
jgi:hypothetical protein